MGCIAHEGRDENGPLIETCLGADIDTGEGIDEHGSGKGSRSGLRAHVDAGGRIDLHGSGERLGLDGGVSDRRRAGCLRASVSDRGLGLHADIRTGRRGLSAGGGDGLGRQRSGELVQSADHAVETGPRVGGDVDGVVEIGAVGGLPDRGGRPTGRNRRGPAEVLVRGGTRGGGDTDGGKIAQTFAGLGPTAFFLGRRGEGKVPDDVGHLVLGGDGHRDPAGTEF